MVIFTSEQKQEKIPLNVKMMDQFSYIIMVHLNSEHIVKEYKFLVLKVVMQLSLYKQMKQMIIMILTE